MVIVMPFVVEKPKDASRGERTERSKKAPYEAAERTGNNWSVSEHSGRLPQSASEATASASEATAPFRRGRLSPTRALSFPLPVHFPLRLGDNATCCFGSSSCFEVVWELQVSLRAVRSDELS